MADLKLYFCVIDSDESLNTMVFRDLTMIRTYWKAEERNNQVGIIHIGFIRPAIDNIQALEEYKGTVLATASARWSLPRGYTCSQSHITTLSVGNEGIPCYLVLKGLGYQRDEPLLEENPSAQLNISQPTNNTMTIADAALQVLNELKTPLSKEAIFGHIVEKGLYRFGAKKPVSALSVQLNRYTQGTSYTQSSDTPFFGKTSEKLYYSLEAISQEPEGWLASFAEAYTEEYLQMSAYGVFNDSEYLKQIDKLPLKLRDLSSIYRFKYLRKNIQRNDIEKLLEIVPYSILNDSITNLGFSVRIENVLIRESVATLEELKQYATTTILSWPYFGKKSLVDLVTVIESRIDTLLEKPILVESPGSNLDTENQDIEYQLETVSQKPLLEHFNIAVETLPARGQDVIRARCGFNGTIETLEEVGTRLGVTRERIRQIQKKHITDIIETEYWDDVISIKIGQLLVDRKEPLTLELLEIEDPWFKGFIDNYTYLSGIIELFTEHQIRVISINSTNVITQIKIEDWKESVSDFRHTLKEKAKEGSYTRGDIDTLFISRLVEIGARELSPLLWNEFDEHLLFDGEEDTATLLSYGKTSESVIRAVLIDAEKPLHYTEVARRATKLFGKIVDDRRAQNALMNQGAKLFGRGIYGLEKFNPLSPKMCENILLISNRIVSNGPLMRQWHSNEILTELKTKFPSLPKELDTYLLNIILFHSNELTYLNRMVWARKDSNQQINDRVDIADAFAKILEDYGAPLKGVDLKNRLSKVRGVNANLQLQPTDRMIQIGPDYWGLIDRDIGGSIQDNNAKLNTLYNHLQQTQKGIHVSEVVLILEKNGIRSTNEPTSYALLNLAQRDDRFYLGRSMFMGLAEWGDDTRRLNNSQAVRIILNDMVKPLTLIEITLMIEKLTGLELEGAASGLLINEGAVYDSNIRKWKSSSII